ncbi:hypothetical protein [Pseudolactococcus insecticola]|uniref:Uncharacterized protein n=1 Tax=Pseudolactococcus insecticola TaxID=2709158 RepID=A0A6A0B515_9LACT|nr:hypothetical protein [Lactococcus insecticola]GFH40302.1 hypothetical protein Hs20B_07000 [Lactococcus insecticola]
MDKKMLLTHIWIYGRPHGKVYNKNVIFLPDGSIKNAQEHHVKWEIKGGKLIIQNDEGKVISTMFPTDDGRFEGEVNGLLRFYKRSDSRINQEILSKNLWTLGIPRVHSLAYGLYFSADGTIINDLSHFAYYRINSDRLTIYNQKWGIEHQLDYLSDERLEGVHGKHKRRRFIKIDNPAAAIASHDKIQALDTQVAETLALLKSSNEETTRENHLKIKVAILLFKYGTASHFIRLVRLLEQDQRFEVRIFIQPNRASNGEYLNNELLEELDAANLAYTAGTLSEVEKQLKHFLPHYVFRQDPWESNWATEFQTGSLQWTNLANIYYTVIDHFIAGALLINYAVQPYFQESKYIFGTIFDETRDYLLSIGQGKLLDKYQDTGNLKAIAISKTVAFWPEQFVKYKKNILFVSHFSLGKDFLKFGLFDEVAEHYRALAKKYPEYSFVWNPHPEFKARHGQLFSDFEDRISELDNLMIVSDRGMHALIAAADVVIADGVSVLYEAQILQKPIIWLERADHKPLSKEGEALMSGVHRLKDYSFEAIDKQLTTIIENGDELAPQQSRNVAPWLSEPHPEEKIADCLYEGIFDGNTSHQVKNSDLSDVTR